MKITQAGLGVVNTDDFRWGLLRTAEQFRASGRSFDECYTALSAIIALTLTGRPAKTRKLVKFMRKNHGLIYSVIEAARELGLRQLDDEQECAGNLAAGQRYVV